MTLTRTVEDVIAEIAPLEPFLAGLTVSGGEPTLQHAFLVDLFAAVKSDPALQRLTTFIDSKGTLDAQGWEALAPWTDGVMLDVKADTPAMHQPITGRDNAAVLASVRTLHRLGLLYEFAFSSSRA